ncbi:MAG: Maf family protein [Deltaproteobacteria bacterium]|jgi:septum formation protein|nr:Maf family protein [Deltaproteobacteria bacterium]
MTLYLASASPRRREILKAAGVPFIVLPACADETPLPGEAHRACVARLARAKAEAVWAQVLEEPGAAVLAADTAVILGEVMLGKPLDPTDAERMLAAISGKTHTVVTSFCVITSATVLEGSVTTAVTVRSLKRGEIEAYVATGDPLDKAGAYAIQGPMGAVLVESLEGSYSNVIGLPLREVLEALRELGVHAS